jgi:hypothetical protein
VTAGSHNPTSTAPGDEYELVVQRIVGQLAKREQVDTTRLEHDVDVQGRATATTTSARDFPCSASAIGVATGMASQGGSVPLG